jgi:hypothetical protein
MSLLHVMGFQALSFSTLYIVALHISKFFSQSLHRWRGRLVQTCCCGGHTFVRRWGVWTWSWVVG